MTAALKHIIMKRLLPFLFALLVALPSLAHDFEVDGIFYNVTSESQKTVSVTCEGYNSDSILDEYIGDVVIPETVIYNNVSYSVTAIGRDSFGHCYNLTSVTIPNSIKTIGPGAFAFSSLTSVTIPTSVSAINDYTFYGCSLTSAIIPNTITYIGEYAFSDSGLTSLTIPNSVTSIGICAFGNCIGLTSVSIPNSVISIGMNAFKGCNSLTSITIPPSITSIGSGAFDGCSCLSVLNFNAENCTSCGDLEQPSFPAQISILNIGESVKTISDYAFCGINGISSLAIPNSVISIGDYSFSGCTSLIKLEIGSSVETIGIEAFNECKSITSISSNNAIPPECKRRALGDINKLECTLFVPASAIDAYKVADQWKYFYKIEAGVEDIMTSDALERPKVTARYDIMGRAVDNSYHGPIIEVMSDGSTAKCIYR